MEFWCYESTLFLSKPWKFAAGIYHKGIKKGKPIPMNNANEGDIAILTTVPPGGTEEERFVFAIFRIGNIIKDEPDWGNTIYSDSSMDVILPDEIAPNIRFWRYYQNKDNSLFWGTGLFRYIPEKITNQFLGELMGALNDRDERDIIYKALNGKVKPLPSPGVPSNSPNGHGGGAGGEGEAHRELKKYVAQNPSAIGLPTNSYPEMEYQFKCGDKVDIKFNLSDGKAAVVEIETIYTLPGAHQCIKYRALLEAERSESIGKGGVKAILVANIFDEDTKYFAKRYDIKLVQLDI
jgi:hypothetical protein